ncbi:hypothetical protein ACFW9D_22650 [Streptomyces sp. NPDC059524]|uniref:hypothetical protein n=1 Tax=Streptomyces sp. NPDC059524 TaxID=3346856 RepID=UPI0036C2B528
MWLGIIGFYYFHALHLEDPYEEVIAGPLWAPEQVALSLSYFYSFAYAVTLGLAVWEGGRLKRDGVWALGPGRSRLRVAAHTLMPVVVAGWLILLLPAVMRLIETQLWPTPAAITPVLMGMGIVIAYAVFGCALGQVAPRLIAAPLAAAAAQYFISGSSSYSPPFWPRHLLGQVDTTVAFGETYGLMTVALPLVFAAVAAAAVAAWWVTTHQQLWIRWGAAAAALAVMATCAFVANGWRVGDGPVSAGHADVTCTGTAPRVCMATAGGAVDRLKDVRTEVVSSIEKLQERGVDVPMPATVTDALLTERHPAGSTEKEWSLPLSRQAGKLGGGMVNIRYAVVLTSVNFPCRMPKSVAVGQTADWIVNRDSAMLWAAKTIDADKPYLSWRKGEYAGLFKNPDDVMNKVKERAGKGYALPAAEQDTWFHEEQAKACTLLKAGNS